MINESHYDETPFESETKTKVLILDDSDLSLQSYRFLLSKLQDESIELLESTTIEEATELLRLNKISVLILDKNLGVDSQGQMINGIKHISDFLQINPALQIVVSTGEGETDDVVDAIRQGAADFVDKQAKPDIKKNKILRAIRDNRALLSAARRQRLDEPKSKIFLGQKSVASLRLNHMLGNLARTNRPVLFLGESGTGKTTWAEYLHEQRNLFLNQPDRPFVKVSVTNLHHEMEGELFGTEKGAFTGVNGKQGLVELANGGTLFLDEIGELKLDAQAKLLEVLQSGTFRRAGGKTVLRSEFHLISATKQDLELLVKEGRFRDDLYHRISPFVIEVPSLKDRTEDIPDIIREILPDHCRDNSTYISYEDIPEDFIRYLQKNPPTGNFRGLQKKLDILLAWSDRDTKGRPILKKWRAIPGLLKDVTPPNSSRNTITYHDILKLDFDMVDDPNFPGLKEMKKIVEAKLFLEARKKFKTKTDIAKALGVVLSSVTNKENLVNSFLKPSPDDKRSGESQEYLQ